MHRFSKAKKVNAGIAARRSVLTRTVVYRNESRMHSCILRFMPLGAMPFTSATVLPCVQTQTNSRPSTYRSQR